MSWLVLLGEKITTIHNITKQLNPMTHNLTPKDLVRRYITTETAIKFIYVSQKQCADPYTNLWDVKFLTDKRVKRNTYQIKDMNEGFDSGFVHGIDILLNPVTQNQIKLQKPSLLAPIQQSIHTHTHTKLNHQTLIFFVTN